MSQMGTHLAGLFDLCFAALSLLIAVLVSYVALDLAAYLRPARVRSSLAVTQTHAPQSRFRSHRSFGCALEPS